MLLAVDTPRQRWAVAAIGAAVVALLVVSVFRAPAIDMPQSAVATKGVELRNVSAANAAQADEALMRDLTPLFLPTERNASLARIPKRELGQTFLDIETPRLGIAGADWRFDRGLPPVAAIEGQPVSSATALDVLEAAALDAPLAGFGRNEARVAGMIPRGGFIEVVNARDGQTLMAEVVTSAGPPTRKPWQPFELMATVGPAGLVAPLMLMTRSGVDEVDVFFRNYLARTFRVGERLPPGFYRITVAP